MDAKQASRTSRPVFAAFACALLLSLIALPQSWAIADEGGLAAADAEALVAESTVAPEADTVAMNRVYNPNSGEHFYTASTKERDGLVRLGWRNEGTGWIAPAKSSSPVYRLYNANGGEHHYTMSSAERNSLIQAGWRDEGIGWYSADASSTRVGLYREYNPNAFSCNHNFTTGSSEHCWLVGLGWRAEGLSWYGLGSTDGATGWFQVGGNWRYYSKGNAVRGWLVTATPPPIARIGGGLQRYWITSSYALAVGRTINPSSSADKGAGYQAYATSGGYVSRNEYLELGGTWYHSNDDGKLSVDAVTNRLVSKAMQYGSSSDYLIMVDVDDPRTVVFEWTGSRWRVKFVWDCCTGAEDSPTITGVHYVGIKGYSFGENHGYSCYYYTQIYGNYLFHTNLYDPYTWNIQDGRMGIRCSGGCVRLYVENAKWIWDNIPSGTTVVTMY